MIACLKYILSALKVPGKICIPRDKRSKNNIAA